MGKKYGRVHIKSEIDRELGIPPLLTSSFGPAVNEKDVQAAVSNPVSPVNNEDSSAASPGWYNSVALW